MPTPGCMGYYVIDRRGCYSSWHAAPEDALETMRTGKANRVDRWDGLVMGYMTTMDRASSDAQTMTRHNHLLILEQEMNRESGVLTVEASEPYSQEAVGNGEP